MPAGNRAESYGHAIIVDGGLIFLGEKGENIFLSDFAFPEERWNILEDCMNTPSGRVNYYNPSTETKFRMEESIRQIMAANIIKFPNEPIVAAIIEIKGFYALEDEKNDWREIIRILLEHHEMGMI